MHLFHLPYFSLIASGSCTTNFPTFSYYLLFLLHGPFSHLTDLPVVPCPKSKQKQIKDNTILLPLLLPKATSSQLFSNINKTFLFFSMFLTCMVKEESIITKSFSHLSCHVLVKSLQHWCIHSAF